MGEDEDDEGDDDDDDGEAEDTELDRVLALFGMRKGRNETRMPNWAV